MHAMDDPSIITQKGHIIFDLDDTLVNTTEANQIGIRRAYTRLASLCDSGLAEKMTLEQFRSHLDEIYKNEKDEKGERRFFDYDAEVFEIFCNNIIPKKDLKIRYKHYSLAARLYWSFKETKNRVLMPDRYAFDLINLLGRSGAKIYCVTQGKCNYQYTKLMLADLEDKMDGAIVANDKTKELKEFVDDMNMPPEDTVIIGDSPSDIKAGKNAGISTIRIRCGGHKDKESEFREDETYNNLEELLRKTELGTIKKLTTIGK